MLCSIIESRLYFSSGSWCISIKSQIVHVVIRCLSMLRLVAMFLCLADSLCLTTLLRCVSNAHEPSRKWPLFVFNAFWKWLFYFRWGELKSIRVIAQTCSRRYNKLLWWLCGWAHKGGRGTLYRYCMCIIAHAYAYASGRLVMLLSDSTLILVVCNVWHDTPWHYVRPTSVNVPKHYRIMSLVLVWLMMCSEILFR